MKIILYIIFGLLLFTSCQKRSLKKSDDFNVLYYITRYKLDTTLNDTLLKSKLSADITKASNSDKNYYYIVTYNKYFKNKYKYLIVWDQLNNKHYWFLNHKNSFINFFQRENSVDFVKDTIDDFNHDGSCDLGIIYHTTGPDMTSILFIDPNNGLIKDTVNIFNYRDIGKNQFIQVINHQSPIVEFSKCKWNCEKVDTIEQVMFDSNEKAKFYFFKDNFPFKDVNGVLKIDETKTLKTTLRLPQEYKKSLIKFYPNFKLVK